MRSPCRIGAVAALPLAVLATSIAMAQTRADEPASPPAPEDKNNKATTLAPLSVTATTASPFQALPAYPATQVDITAAQIDATVNAIDVEDAAKYLPSVFIRKRNDGDTQPVLATRDWGVNSSARTLVYVDDIPVSALIANNNTIGAPRWGMVSPDEIDHIDMLYGPFSAAYPGNAMGGVMRLVTRIPDQPQVTIEQTEALQTFDLYGTHGHYSTGKTAVTASGRHGRFSWLLGANSENSFSQPLVFITSASTPPSTNGTLPAINKTGQVANVLGAGGLLHTRMLNLDGKFAYDITPSLQAAYWIGYWSNDGQSRAQTYLTSTDGSPTYGKAAAFASDTYGLDAHHLMQALSLKSDTKGDVDGSLVVTHYDFIKDSQWSPAAVLNDTTFKPTGLLASYAGTNWSTIDLTGFWRPLGYGGGQELSAGAHADQYTLANPTDNLAAWQNPQSATTLYSAGSGKTRTRALWMQDAWQFTPDWLATFGGRYEQWKASGGFNFSGTTAVDQPTEKASGFSPKLTLQWTLAPTWQATGSLAQSLRFPTVGELYQLVSTGTTYSTPNPDLKPERDRSGELAIEHDIDDGSVRLSLFQENTRQALISQTSTLAGYAVPVTYTMNVGEVRDRGIELVAQRDNVLVEGLQLSGSVTLVDSATLADASFVSTTGTTAVGKQVPYVPRWRATALATYRPTQAWALTLAGRYSAKQYSTLDNTDNTPDVFGAFDRFLVFDAHVSYQVNTQLSASVGVDNLTNEKYFLYHPFPQRTYVANMKFRF